MPSRDEDLEALIKEIADKHGILVGRDDPIFVLQTINQRLLKESARAQEEQLDQFTQRLEELGLTWSSDAKERAERILAAGLRSSSTLTSEVLARTGNEIAVATQKEMDAALTKVTAPLSDAYRVSVLNLVASCITLLAALTLAVAGLL